MLSPFATKAGVDRLIHAAQAAPSIFNTQPWSFEIVADDRIDLRADRSRQLMAVDRLGRELTISCGAALFNLRMAFRVTGHDPIVWLLPDQENDPDLLASVEIVLSRPRAPTIIEQRLYETIPWRHTNREPFSSTRLGMNIVAELEHAAWKERCYLWLLHSRDTKQLLHEIAEADRVLKADPSYRAELRQYTNDRAPGFGIPATAFGPLPQKGHVPFRDLGLEWPGKRRVARFEKRTRLLALSTETDTPLDWLRAGQGLQRVLLTATRRNVAASFYTQPLELSDRRPKNAHPRWPWPKYAQMVMRMGYGPTAGATKRDASPHVADLRAQPRPPARPGLSPRPAP
jgi:nitroreductase